MSSLSQNFVDIPTKCAVLDARVHKNWFTYATIVTLMLLTLVIWGIWIFSPPESRNIAAIVILVLLILGGILGYHLIFNSNKRVYG